MPSKYKPSINKPCKLIIPKIKSSGTMKAIKNTYTGKRAEQLIMGVIKIVMRRSFKFSIVMLENKC
jgi:hypothetical protein